MSNTSLDGRFYGIWHFDSIKGEQSHRDRQKHFLVTWQHIRHQGSGQRLVQVLGLLDRQVYVIHGSKTSSTIQELYCVPQGSVLGPSLDILQAVDLAAVASKFGEKL